MQAVAPGVVAAVAAFAADRAAAIEVQAAGHAGVDRGEVAVGVAQRVAAAGLRPFEVIVLEQVGGAVRGFLDEKNPAALREIAERFREAIDRGLWHPRRNAVQDRLAALTEGSTR